MNIIEFLEARIAEDEADNRDYAKLEDDDRGGWAIVYSQRVLAECATKRSILADRKRIDRSANPDDWSAGYSDGNYDALHALAAVYKDHPDYQQEWAA